MSQTPIRAIDAEPIAPERVLRAWIAREADKSDYPDAGGAVDAVSDAGRLTRILRTVYEEPADAATAGDPTWIALRLRGRAVGAFAPFPGSGWTTLSGGGTIADAVDRLRRGTVDGVSETAAAIDGHRARLPGDDLGAVVARERDGEWPPVLLDGNHRACAARRAAAEGTDVIVTVHLVAERPFAACPIEQTDG